MRPAIGCLLFIAALLVTGVAHGDAYEGKEDVKPDGEKIVVYNIDRPGGLLPFKTAQLNDRDRPKFWNGYGVDPTGPSYWVYWSEETLCYEGYRDVWEGSEWDCSLDEIKKSLEVQAIPEPVPLLLTGFGLLVFLILKKKRFL